MSEETANDTQMGVCVSTVRMPQQLADDLELVANQLIATGQWSVHQIVGLFDMIRQDLIEGPDPRPSTFPVARSVDRVEDRRKRWEDILAREAAPIRHLRETSSAKLQ